MTQPSAELAALFTPVLEWLDRGGDEQMGFNMVAYLRLPLPDQTSTPDYASNACGITCCISGAVGLFNPAMRMYGCPADTQWDRANHACLALQNHYGMSPDDRAKLFSAHCRSTPAQAAATIRHWIETGDVVWGDVE